MYEEEYVMDIETRMLEEWKANSELLKFYEDLKQKRFAHFLTIQTAFLAFFALLAKDALITPSMVSLTALVLIAIPPLIISYYFIRVDTRSRAFVDTTNTRLLLIEEERKATPRAVISRHTNRCSQYSPVMTDRRSRGTWTQERLKTIHSNGWHSRGPRMPANTPYCKCSGGFGLSWRARPR